MAVPAAAPGGAPPEAAASTSRPWGKYLPWIVAGIVVIVVVGIIRLTSSKSPDSLTPTTVTTTTAGSAGGTTTAGAAGSATKTAYITASTQIDAANAAATRGLAGGAGTSVAQVTTVVTQYQKGLQTFVFAVHSLQWTGATKASSDQLTLEIQTMVTYLGTVSSVDAATLHVWLDKFHSLSKNIQTADNTVRGQLGIAITKSYP